MDLRPQQLVFAILSTITFSFYFTFSSPCLAVDRPIQDKWALVIGISKYKDSRIPTLQYPAKDAKDFAEFLISKGNFARDHVLLLTDDKATHESIKTAIGDAWLPKRAIRDDLVLLYVSTHGSPKELDVGKENWLIAHDTDLNKLYTTGIELEELCSTIKQRTGCDRIVLLLDACNSGAAQTGTAKGMFRASNFDINSVVGQGEIVISSSEANQRSWESKRYQNGVFTRKLIEALENGGSSGKLADVFNKLKTDVEVEVRADRRASQIPVFKSKWEGTALALLSPPIAPRQMQESSAPKVSIANKMELRQKIEMLWNQSKNKKLPDWRQKEKELLKLAKYGTSIGDSYSENILGVLYEHGSPENPKDMNKALKHYENAAGKGLATAQFNLGLVYLYGKAGNRDYKKAFEFFGKAAKQNNAEACGYYGNCFLQGYGTEVNATEAKRWFQKGASLGDVGSTFSLGSSYYTGSAGDQDFKQAFAWYKKAAEAGSMLGQANLCQMYRYGKGIKKDKKLAFKWGVKAGEQGKTDCQVYIAHCYKLGYGVKKNKEKAFQWFHKAADLGYAEGQFYLGQCYEKGIGTEKDLKKAKKWYTKASNQNHVKATKKLQKLSK